MSDIFRAHPLYINGLKVAEASSTTEDRNVNAALQYGIEGVVGFSLGADETKFSFDTVVPVTGMNINIDDILGVPVTLGSVRDGRMALSDGVIMSSNYSSDSKTGESKGKFEFIGGKLTFV